MLPSHIHAKKWFSERNSSLAVSSLYPELVQLYKAGRNYTNHWDQCLSIKSYQSSKKKKKNYFNMKNWSPGMHFAREEMELYYLGTEEFCS